MGILWTILWYSPSEGAGMIAPTNPQIMKWTAAVMAGSGTG